MVNTMTPPVAKKIPKKIVQHGYERVDNYAWLRDKNWKSFIKGDLSFHNPEILDYINAENAWTEKKMGDCQETIQTIYNEILSLEKEEDSSFPMQRGEYDYYWRQWKKDNYAIFYRKKRVDGSTEEIYFNINKEAKDKPLYNLGKSDTSEDNQFFCYAYNLSGSMEKTLRVRNLDTGKDLDWKISDSTGSWLWIDNEHIYFVERDRHSRGKNVYKINIHEGPSSKKLIFSKPEQYSNMFLSLGSTQDKAYLKIVLMSGSTEVHYLSQKGTDEFNFFVKGENNITYFLEHHNGIFYILTNRGERHNYFVTTCPASGNHTFSQWKIFIADSFRHYIQSITIYNDFLVMIRKNCQNALSEIEICHLVSQKRVVVSMPGIAYCLKFIGMRDHTSTKVRFALETPLSQEQMFELDLTDASSKLLREKVPPNFDPAQYVLKREFAKAKDGEKIPLTIVHKKGLKLDGSHNAFVYSYGSYGFAVPPYFSQSSFSLINRNFVYCIAHIRGGDDKGLRWYLDGKMHKKMNTFNDFIDSCKYLIEKKYTSKKLLAINGGSAGGLLMGAVTNMAPDLLGVVVADVPFVDVVNTISDSDLPLTPPEWEEWGNPVESKEDFEYMMRYSPYDNIEVKNYPHILYQSGISDEQVTYWEPLKMVAKLREHKCDDNELLLKIKMQSGHSGASKKHEWIQDQAFAYGFVLKSLKKSDPNPTPHNGCYMGR